jgi:hypothetical protein
VAKQGLFTKILSVVGVVLVGLPVLAPVFFSLAYLMMARVFRFDYLMPAELFPFALVGSLLLLWAALRARSRRGLIGGGLAIAVSLLVGAQVLAEVTGIASGRSDPTGVWFVLALAGIVGYALALVVIEAGGLLLLRELLKPSHPPVKAG